MNIPLISASKKGFRLSQIDIIVLVLAGLITIFYPNCSSLPPPMYSLLHWLIPYVVANFFLFCNVFRVRTKYELCWLVIATINLILYIAYYNNNTIFFLTQSCFTIIAIILQIKNPKYNGVFAK